MKLADMKVGTRLGIGFGSLLVLLFVITGIGVWCLQTVGNLTNHMVDEALVKERLVTGWHSATQLNGARTFAVIDGANPEGQNHLEGLIKATSQHITEIQKQLEALPKHPEEGPLYADIADKREAYLSARKAVFNEKKTGNEEAVRKLVSEGLEPALNNYLVSINRLTGHQAKLIATLSDNVKNQYRTGQVLVSVLGGLALLVGIIAATLITRTLLRQLGGEPGHAVMIAGRIAAGDLCTDIVVKRNDQSSLMFAMKAMCDSLVNIVDDVRNGTASITDATNQIATGNLDLSNRTEEQASSLEQTASSMEELTTTVKQNADHANQAKMLAISASDVALKGGAVVSQVVDTMGSINESAKKIVDIISVIDGIAFQTNILALNAAVEAARAGEQGRGFAVVASEVRNLAQRSAGAAKEIKELIVDSVEKVNLGSELVDRAGNTMNEVVDSVKRVADIINEIAGASQEQTIGIEQVNQAIIHMDQVTQQNAALVEQAAAAADSMKEQARTLVDAVSVFSLADTNAGNKDAVTMSRARTSILALSNTRATGVY